MMFTDAVQIGMADYKVGKAPKILATLGLGSCVAVCMYDQQTKIGGLVHIMLPDSSISKGDLNPAKFADSAVPLMARELQSLGASIQRMVVKIVGGAHMFTFKTEDSTFEIGARNIDAVELACKKLGLTIIARSVGGNCGRSVWMDLNSGILTVKTINQGIQEI